MADLIAAAQQALEVLENSADQLPKPYSTDASNAIIALRTALAQAEPVQPVATFDDPYRDHWAAIAEAAQRIAASKECGPAEAKALCAALDRLTEATLAEPVAFDPAEAMRLADDYASAQSEMDVEQNLNRRPYYIESRNAARAKLACYLGIKGGGNG